jgi:MFS family permease
VAAHPPSHDLPASTASPDATALGSPPPWREVFRGKRGRLTVGLLLLEALVAIQVLVVATILPDIRRDLGMVQLYGLVFTASSLATLGAIPIAGRAVDRFGARATLTPVLACFTAGLVVSACAPAMPVLLIGQCLQGAGGGGLYALAVGAIAKTYPDRLRPRVMALLASMWILPGLIGPPVGAIIASTIGWRWTFLAPIPVLIGAWILITPALGLIPDPEPDSGEGFGLRWPLQLVVGAGLVFTSFTFVQVWAIAMFAAGLVIGIPALRAVVPAGTFRAAPGAPASALAAFLLSLGFLAMDGFLTLMLTDVRDLSLGAAGIAITLATLTWALGSAWQSGRAQRMPLPRLLRIGAIATIAGQVFVMGALLTEVPVGAAFVGWAIVGFGMGVAFPTIPLAVMRMAIPGREAEQLSSVLVMDVLGMATGAGLGGGAIALAAASGTSLAVGIGASFVMGLIALAILVVVGRNIVPAGSSRSDAVP